MRTVASRHLFPTWAASAPGRVYLMAYNGSTAIFNYGIGLAASWDGISWTKLTPSTAAIEIGSGWESALVKDPMLLKVAPGDYRMWYAGSNTTTFSSSPFKIGYATSSNGVVWTKYGSNPVLSPSVSGWDSLGVEFPSVLYDPTDVTRPFKMWYAGSTGSNNEQQIGYAYSTDGITWTKSSANPVLTIGAGGSYDAVSAYPSGSVVKSGGTYYLFYAGRASTGPTVDAVCLATFTDPEGTYTKSGSNPLLSPVSSANQVLTSNLSAGAAIVNVASTAAFHVNEPCMLTDTTDVSTDTAIGSINSGTQMTLAAPPAPPVGSTVPYNWTTANTARIASVYYQAVDPRCVVPSPSGSGYVMYLSPFDQFGVSPYRERSAAATSASLASGWAFDYARGIVLPLGNLWDTISAENPSVIAE